MERGSFETTKEQDETMWAEAMVTYIARNKEHLDQTGSLEILVPEGFEGEKLAKLESALQARLPMLVEGEDLQAHIVRNSEVPTEAAFVITKKIDVLA